MSQDLWFGTAFNRKPAGTDYRTYKLTLPPKRCSGCNIRAYIYSDLRGLSSVSLFTFAHLSYMCNCQRIMFYITLTFNLNFHCASESCVSCRDFLFKTDQRTIHYPLRACILKVSVEITIKHGCCQVYFFHWLGWGPHWNHLVLGPGIMHVSPVDDCKSLNTVRRQQ